MKTLLLLSFLLVGFAAQAQTNFNTWDQFQSSRFGFTMRYPDLWEVNEESNGNYSFHNPYEHLGMFRVIVDDRGDSATAANDLVRLERENNGIGQTPEGTDKLVMYKSMIVQDGINTEVHHWVIQEKNTLYRCSYSFDTTLRNAPNLVEEMKLAYQTIESLTFTKND